MRILPGLSFLLIALNIYIYIYIYILHRIDTYNDSNKDKQSVVDRKITESGKER